MLDIHWLYRTSRYAIVKVDVTDRNDVNRHDGNCHRYIWRTSANDGCFYLPLTPMIDSKNLEQDRLRMLGSRSRSLWLFFKKKKTAMAGAYIY